MRTTSVFILLLVLSLGYDVAVSSSGDQVAWRWRNDDGNVYTATWRDSINTPTTVTQGENMRLRIEDLVTNAGSSRMTLHYSEDPLGGVWFPVTASDTGKFFLWPSPNLIDGMSYGDNQLLPPENATNVYRRTITVDSSLGFVLTTESSSIYEIEYSIKATSRITAGGAYFFSAFLDSALMGGSEYAVLQTPPVHWRVRSLGGWCYFNGIAFTDAEIGIAVGGGYSGGTVFRTTDGGNTWLNVSSPPCEGLNAIAFADARVGIAVSWNGMILRTTDAGETWAAQTRFANASKSMYALAFSDRDSGVIMGWADNVARSLIWRTTDGGVTWTERAGPINRHFFSVSFATDQVGCAVGEAGAIIRTTNGGGTWAAVQSATTSDLHGMAFADANVGVAVGGGWGPGEAVINRTTDGGARWTRVPNAQGYGLCAISFVDTSVGLVVGDGGWISKTTDGGMTWTRLASGACRYLRAVCSLDRERSWVVGDNGMILSTTDGGGTTSVDPRISKTLPTEVALMQNYPNPFNPQTRIRFTIAHRQWTVVSVFDLLGRDVATLVNETMEPGTYTVEFDGSHLATGVYLYRLTTGDVSQTRKMMILK